MTRKLTVIPEAFEAGNFPRTRRDTDQGNAPVIFNAPVTKPERSNADAILAELRQQTVYLRNVNRLVNFVWAGLLSVAAVAVAGVVGWILIVSVMR